MTAGWGEVWWVELPHTQRRPGLVLTRPEAISILPVVLVAPLTTVLRGLPTEVVVDEDDGMAQRSVINLDTPELIPKGSLIAHMTTLAPARMHQVCRALGVAVNCSPPL